MPNAFPKFLSLCAAGMTLIVSTHAATPDQRGPDDNRVEEIERTDDSERRGRSQSRVRGPLTILRPGGLMLASFDKNGDFQVDQTELDKGKAHAFTILDKDGNGRASLIELQAWRLQVLGSEDATPGTMHFDPNFDQTVSKDEFNESVDFLFNRADADDNSVVEFSELIEIRDQSRSGQRQSRDRGGEGSNRGGGRRGDGGGRGGGGR